MVGRALPLAEIGLTESDIVCVHGKAVLLHHGRQSRFFQLNEARQCGNAIGGRVFRGQRRLPLPARPRGASTGLMTYF